MGHFPQVYEQVNEWPILKLHEMIRLLHVVACPVTSILFEDRDWQGEVMKNDLFLVFLSVWVNFPKFLDPIGVPYVRTEQNNKSVTFIFVPNCFHFILWATLVGRSVESYEK